MPDFFVSETGPGFTSINAAIAAAAAGDTIHVLAGTYVEDVLVNKDVTILGAHAGQAGFAAGRGTGESILEGTFRFTADGATVDGFEIVGAGSPSSNPIPLPFPGEAFPVSVAIAADNITFTNNIVDGASEPGAVGLETSALGGGGTTGELISNNLITNWDLGAYLIESTTGSVANNHFIANLNGIQTESTAAVISGNTFSGDTSNGQIFALPFDPVVNLNSYIFANNTILIASARPVQIFPNTHGDTDPRVITGTDFNETYRGDNPFPPTSAVGPHTFFGNGGDDLFFGGILGDNFTGGPGNDGPAPTNPNDGGPGIDTAHFAGNRSNYSVNLLPGAGPGGVDVIQVIDLRPGSPEGTDNYINFENFAFADGTFAAAPALANFAVSSASANEGDQITFTVTRSGDTSAIQTVNFATTFGTAGSADFTAASGTLTFIAGEVTQTITVQTTEDTLDEANETFTVNLFGATGGAEITTPSATGTIVDDDPPTVFSIGPASIEEGGVATFTVTRAGGAQETQTVTVTTGSGTAVQGVDFTGTSQVLTFAQGVASQTFTVQTIEDTQNEPNETFTASLSNATAGATLSGTNSQATGTILDDDPAAQGAAPPPPPPPLFTPFDDDVTLGDGDDTADALAGNDVVRAGGGNDVVFGGEGNDRLAGQAGNDTLAGGPGNDQLGGGDGNDTLAGGSGDDVIFGEAGNDSANGTEGNDVMLGGDGNDFFGGGSGNDTVNGDAGTDVLWGEDGNDILSGGADNDIAFGGNGADVLFGDGGNDNLFGEADNDVLIGGAGEDSLSGGFGNDDLQGGDGNDNLFGDAGNDFLTGGAGNDIEIGGPGDDTFVFRPGDGIDTILDFTPGAGSEDRILMIGTSLTSFAAVQAVATFDAATGTTVIPYNGTDQLRIAFVTPAQLNAADFAFL